jgi:parallel beta-helix repeat protein
MSRRRLSWAIATTVVLGATLGLAGPAQARWRALDISPQAIAVGQICQDGMTFEFADVRSQGDQHPHPRPAGSPDFMTYSFVAESPPTSGTIVANTTLTMPYNPIDIISSPFAGGVEHRDYSGTFRIAWSIPAGSQVELHITGVGSQLVYTVENCQLPAQPPGCGKVITKNTKLRTDLVNCVGDAIVIGADKIKLDLNGHTIDGTGWGAGVKNTAGHTGVRIENGTIKEFRTAVELTGASDNRVQGLSTTANDEGIALLTSDDNKVERSTASGNDTNIYVVGNGNEVERNAASGSTFGEGIVAIGSENDIERNTVTGNAFGILLAGTFDVASTDNDVVRNTVTGNSESGIFLTSANRNQVERNAVSSNGLAGVGFIQPGGIRLEASEENVITRNAVSENGGDGGISLAGNSNGNQIVKNSISRSVGAGVFLNSDNNLVQGNSADRNIQGFFISDSNGNRVTGNSASGNRVGVEVTGFATNNRVDGNSVLASTEDGIQVSSDVLGTAIEDNVSNGNLDDGIDVDSSDPSNRLSRNIANQNGDLGIEASAGTTDGGGNRASGNGNAVQCTGVACS